MTLTVLPRRVSSSQADVKRARSQGRLASMGNVGDALDNAVAESFFGTLQTELLDRHSWTDRRQLARAVFHLDLPHEAGHLQ